MCAEHGGGEDVDGQVGLGEPRPRRIGRQRAVQPCLAYCSGCGALDCARTAPAINTSEDSRILHRARMNGPRQINNEKFRLRL